MTLLASPDVVVVGGGLAGLSATAALARAGARVTLLEWRPYFGGRAYSYQHPALNETIDSQHVVLGCCTDVIDLVHKAGIADWIRWYDQIVFLEPHGQQTWLRPGRLPVPLHQIESFLRAPMLGLRDKLAIGRGMLRFLCGYPHDDTESFSSWLRRTGQTDRAIRHFWEPIVVATLNDSFDRCSVKYAGKVFHESMLRSGEGGRLGIPTRPLSEFFKPVAESAASQGATLQLRTRLESLRRTPAGNWRLQLSGDQILETPAVVLATDLRQTEQLLGPLRGETPTESGIHAQAVAEHFHPAPITTIHLWYDREFTSLDHAALLDTRIQWLFHKSRIRRWPTDRGSYLELVISGSFAELDLPREHILAEALRELALFFPAAQGATLLKSTVLKEARATFSVTPGLDRYRPQQRTTWPGLFLAGDWTRTEWPSTMESAVRSGRLAAGAVLNNPHRFLAPELPATGLMRWLSHPQNSAYIE